MAPTHRAGLGRGPHRHAATAIPMGVVGWAAVPRRPPRSARCSPRHRLRPRLRRATPTPGTTARRRPLFECPAGADGRLRSRSGSSASGWRRRVAVSATGSPTRGVVEVSVGGRDLVVLHAPGQASALDTRPSPRGRRSAASASSSRSSTDGAHFQQRGGRRSSTRRRARAGTSWVRPSTVRCAAPGCPAQRHLDTFWFAWVAFQPDTRIG